MKVESRDQMSLRKYNLVISDEAKYDFRDILSYTLQKWGEKKFLEYKKLLDNALIDIMQNPKLGNYNFPPYSYIKAGKHYIFYKIKNNDIAISRILHGRMDFKKHLRE